MPLTGDAYQTSLMDQPRLTKIERKCLSFLASSVEPFTKRMDKIFDKKLIILAKRNRLGRLYYLVS